MRGGTQTCGCLLATEVVPPPSCLQTPFRLEPTQEFPQSPSWSRFELRAAQIGWRPAGSWRIDGAILALRPRLRSRNNHKVSSDDDGGGQLVDGARSWRSWGGGGVVWGAGLGGLSRKKNVQGAEAHAANQKLRLGGCGIRVQPRLNFLRKHSEVWSFNRRRSRLLPGLVIGGRVPEGERRPIICSELRVFCVGRQTKQSREPSETKIFSPHTS